MEKPKEALRVILVESYPDDAGKLQMELRQAGYDADVRRVRTKKDFTEALRSEPDLVLARSVHPEIDGRVALRTLETFDLEIPIIILTEKDEGERALASVRDGAFDYVEKDRLERLGVAVSRAVADKHSRRKTRELETQLLQAQKTEAIGLLTGGVAHDFNNILTVITGQCQLLLSQPVSEACERSRLEIIDRAAERGAGLTRQLLAFSRRQMLQPSVLDLNGVLKEMSSMLTRVLGEDIVVDMDLASELGRVRADRGHVDQVIMNLAVNARDAMPRGGKLTLRTANVEVDHHWASAHPGVQRGHYVLFSVSDLGEGMPKEILERIFEPFYTTKENGRGTGLGLSTVQGIVHQNGGYVYVSSEPGEGSTFYVLFPRVDEAVKLSKEEPIPASSAKGEGKILVVEDDDAVRTLVREVLEYSGYLIVECSEGREALGKIEREEGKIDLVITDVVMPGMSGDEFAKLLAARYRDIKVLYTSGHTERPVALPLVPGYRELIQKPFRFQELVQKVRELIAPPSELEGSSSP